MSALVLDVRLVRASFVALGLQVGAFAVLVPELAASRGVGPGPLGVLLAVGAVTGVATLASAGRVSDRLGARPLLVGGSLLFAVAFLGLALTASVALTVPCLMVFGVASGLLDLGANSAGARAEALHGGRRMVGFHAGFSGAAATSALLVSVALAAGASGAVVYGACGVVYALVGGALTIATRGRAVVAPTGAAGPASAAPPSPAASRSPAGRPLWRTPGVAVAVVLCTLCFLGDGALESFSALVLRDALGAGVVLTGAGIAGFHLAMLAGRLALRDLAARPALVGGGCGAAVGVGLMVLAPAPWVGVAGLFAVGFALAPVVPTTLSLAARAAPDRPGAAVSLVTSVGYSAFVASPPLAGLVASVAGLDAALVPVIATTLAVALVAGTSATVRRLG